MKQGLEVAAWAVGPLRVKNGDGGLDEGSGSERSAALENANDGNSLGGGLGGSGA